MQPIQPQNICHKGTDEAQRIREESQFTPKRSSKAQAAE